MQQTSRNFHNYKVWQDAVTLATLVYDVTAKLPWFEKKGLCDQLQRAVVSISSNIAEGSGRPTDNDFSHYLDMALGSANEVETQLLIARRLNYVPQDQYDILVEQVISVQKQLTGLITSIRSNF